MILLKNICFEKRLYIYDLQIYIETQCNRYDIHIDNLYNYRIPQVFYDCAHNWIPNIQ